MIVETGEISISTTSGTDVIDLTSSVNAYIEKLEIKNGAVTLFVPGSTASLTTIEYESGVIKDLIKAIDRLAPEDLYYEHNERWGDGNGYSHVRAALLGPSLHIPIIDGRVILGTWQQIVLIDFDNRSRKRRIVLQVMGEGI